jgi:hypothetical protein
VLPITPPGNGFAGRFLSALPNRQGSLGVAGLHRPDCRSTLLAVVSMSNHVSRRGIRPEA